MLHLVSWYEDEASVYLTRMQASGHFYMLSGALVLTSNKKGFTKGAGSPTFKQPLKKKTSCDLGLLLPYTI